jgi:hypothetical protein
MGDSWKCSARGSPEEAFRSTDGKIRLRTHLRNKICALMKTRDRGFHLNKNPDLVTENLDCPWT